jgi:hypothetical protein
MAVEPGGKAAVLYVGHASSFGFLGAPGLTLPRQPRGRALLRRSQGRCLRSRGTLLGRQGLQAAFATDLAALAADFSHDLTEDGSGFLVHEGILTRFRNTCNYSSHDLKSLRLDLRSKFSYEIWKYETEISD